MSVDILFDRFDGATRAALVDDGRLVEMMIARDDEPSFLDAIYLGRVARVVPGLDGCFVDLGDAGGGFLSARRLGPPAKGGKKIPIGRRVHEGQWLVVQVIGDAVDDKDPVLSADIRLIGTGLTYRPFGDTIELSRRLTRCPDADAILARAERALDGLAGGFVVRRAGGSLGPGALAAEARALRNRWDEIAAGAEAPTRPRCLQAAPNVILRALRDWSGAASAIVAEGGDLCQRLRTSAKTLDLPRPPKVIGWLDPAPLFEAREINAEIATALAPQVALAGGGSLVIAETAALTTIDVNSGGRGEQAAPERTAFQTNRAAAAEIARQLRLRQIGGAIVIDFIRLRGRQNRHRLIDELGNAFADDPVPVDIYGWTRLGHVEIVRHARGRRLSRMPR